MSPFRRLWNVVRGRHIDDDLQQEFETHLALIEDEERADGISAEQARRNARARFGNPLVQRERAVDAVKARWFENACKDVIFAARRLRHSPAFTVATVLTLALAIGANASIFAVVHRVLVNPLPYPDSDRLVDLDFSMPSRNIPSIKLTSRLYYEYLDRAHTLDALALYRSEERTLTGLGTPERIRVSLTTPSLASVLRVIPATGRWFTEEEGAPGALPVAVISHGLWTRRFGQDATVLGRLLTLDGVATTVVGVMRPSYAFPDSGVEAWIPMRLTRASASDAYSIPGVGRLRDGATLADVRTALNRLDADLARRYAGGGYDQLLSTATTLIDATVGRVSRVLWILLASVGLVLLVACANVANLFLVRSEARQREVAVRRALGASGAAIARYFLSESGLLSLAGGVIGLTTAWIAVDLLVAYGPRNFPRLEEVRIDGVVLAFTFILSLLTAVAFGSIPLMRITPLAASLYESGRHNTASRDRHRARHLLMGGQMALALMLLLTSGLMLRSFQKLRAVDPGFDATSALTFRVGLPRSDYPDRGRMVGAHRAILDRLLVLPGVTHVSASTCLPLSGFCNQAAPLFVQGRPLTQGTNPPIVMFHATAGAYFEAMGTRILRGRGIEPSDVERDEPIAVINEALVNVLFPNEDPIGKRVRLGEPSTSTQDPGWLTIAGVVSNTPTRALGEPTAVPKLYMPTFTSREVNLAPRPEAMSYVVRTALPPLSLTSQVRTAVADIDPKLPLAQLRTLQDIVDGASAQMAFTMFLLVVAAGVALMLGVIGVYGVMSYIVTQRTGEIGVRLALGAEPASIAAMIAQQGGLVAFYGVAVGLVMALVGSRLIGSLLYGVTPRDPAVFATTTLLLLAVALLACWLPARRAARLSPLEALRME
jgi:putative ABC transport system permease protein